MERAHDWNVKDYVRLMEPKKLTAELPLSSRSYKTVMESRKVVQSIIAREEPRLLAIVGPCSIHDNASALDYARRLNELRLEVSETMFVVMRVYFEKPRTTVGWKGLINDPHMDGTCNILDGLRKARRILAGITEMGLPTATEFLDPISPQYLADLISWAAVGARTSESQTHRQMASGLSMPVGFKNGTDGNLDVAVNAMLAARAPQSFIGIDHDGHTCIVQTTGNPYGHLVLRGGKRPNYDPLSIEEARLQLAGQNLPEGILVDCSHANSKKKFQGQPIVWRNLIQQALAGNDALIGLMLESNLYEGNQKYSGDSDALAYGVSITDECISWETTESLLRWAHEQLLAKRSAGPVSPVRSISM